MTAQEQQYTPPAEQEIDETFDLIQDRLEEPAMKLAKNQQVKLGYEKALEVLDGTIKMQEQIADIKGVQASAIASLTLDYLKGECSQKALLGVPLKDGVKPMIN